MGNGNPPLQTQGHGRQLGRVVALFPDPTQRGAELPSQHVWKGEHQQGDMAIGQTASRMWKGPYGSIASHKMKVKLCVENCPPCACTGAVLFFLPVMGTICVCLLAVQLGGDALCLHKRNQIGLESLCRGLRLQQLLYRCLCLCLLISAFSSLLQSVSELWGAQKQQAGLQKVFIVLGTWLAAQLWLQGCRSLHGSRRHTLAENMRVAR